MSKHGHCPDCGIALEKTGCPNCNEEDFIQWIFAEEIEEIRRPPMPTNEPGGLYLVLGTENSEPWTFPCKGCDGKGQRLDDVPPYYGAVAVIDCHECKGKGQRRVRLVGKVAVELDCGTYSDPPTIYIPLDLTNGKLIEAYIGTSGGEVKQLVTDVTAAYRANTLPAAVRDGLHEEDCDEAM